MADPGFPCCTHPSLGSLLSRNNISWTYYGDAAHNLKDGTDLWTAIYTARHSTTVTHSAVAAWFRNWPRNPVGRGNTRCCTLSPATMAPSPTPTSPSTARAISSAPPPLAARTAVASSSRSHRELADSRDSCRGPYRTESVSSR